MFHVVMQLIRLCLLGCRSATAFEDIIENKQLLQVGQPKPAVPACLYCCRCSSRVYGVQANELASHHVWQHSATSAELSCRSGASAFTGSHAAATAGSRLRKCTVTNHLPCLKLSSLVLPACLLFVPPVCLDFLQSSSTLKQAVRGTWHAAYAFVSFHSPSPLHVYRSFYPSGHLHGDEV
jgi:hypothetical protein